MPLILSLAAPGSTCRLSYFARTRLAHPLRYPPSIPHTRLHTHQAKCSSPTSPRLPTTCTRKRILSPWTYGGIGIYEWTSDNPRHYSTNNIAAAVDADPIAFVPDPSNGSQPEEKPTGSQRKSKNTRYNAPFQGQATRRMKKSQRQSQPTMILDSIHGPARKLYATGSKRKPDLSHSKLTSSRAVGNASLKDQSTQPVSLYTILARFLEFSTTSPWAELEEFELNEQEIILLESSGYTKESVKRWGSSLVSQSSSTAAEIFRTEGEMPPLFILQLFLRRTHMKTSALGSVMRHVEHRLREGHISWTSLKVLIVRLLRHARVLWPELIPRIASIFSAEATRIYEQEVDDGLFLHNMRSDMTRFCNSLLKLLSLPASIRPLLSSVHQENAQFQILQFMASCTPAMVVTQVGFRSVARTQLAHGKTTQEREWAELKGPSWPPWKENRDALDEDKAYEFGVSRASRILQQMYEAGYVERNWESTAQVYAGWDTDMSPTIQTRTSLPRAVDRTCRQHLRGLLWAARITATRTRREAWACFLTHESEGESHQEAYFAMFEKLYHPETTATAELNSQPPMGNAEQAVPALLPGDMKEVQPDPKSPLHLVYLSEHVPTYEQLYERMTIKGIRPTKRLLALLVETHPDYSTVIALLESARRDFDGGVGRLLDGTLSVPGGDAGVPHYFLVAFIKFLCRFSHLAHSPTIRPTLASPEEHGHRLDHDRHYRFEFAHKLLLHYKPLYRPAWTAFMLKLIFSNWGPKKRSYYWEGMAKDQYTIICDLVEQMDSVGLDIDLEQFRLVCRATQYAAQFALRHDSSKQNLKDVLTTGSRRLRTLFHDLVGTHPGLHSLNSGEDERITIPPHVPGPSELHAYVRALGFLGDFEGLYSLSSWLTQHHSEVTARANGQHSGPRALYRMLVALRAVVDGSLDKAHDGAPEELAQLIRQQIESVEAWGGWPPRQHVELYTQGQLGKEPSIRKCV